MRTQRLSALAAVAFAWLAAASGASAANQTVTATPSDAFSPASVTIAPGEMVTWTNGGGIHNVRFEDGSFQQPANPSGSTWTVSRTFDAPDTFRYYCSYHGPSMSGTVNVSGGGSPPGPTPPGPAPPGAPYPGYPPPGDPSPGPSPAPQRPAITLQLSDATPRRGHRVRFFGSVRPAYDGDPVHIQRRTRGGSFRTVAQTTLRDAGPARSVFSRRLRILADGVFRARVPAGEDHAAGTGPTRRVDVR